MGIGTSCCTCNIRTCYRGNAVDPKFSTKEDGEEDGREAGGDQKKSSQEISVNPATYQVANNPSNRQRKISVLSRTSQESCGSVFGSMMTETTRASAISDRDPSLVKLEASMTKLTADERRLIYKELYKRGVTQRHKTNLVAMATVTMSSYDGEKLRLEYPKIEWGSIRVERQVPQKLPFRISSGVYYIFAILGARHNNLSSPPSIRITGRLNREKISLKCDLLTADKQEHLIVDRLLNTWRAESIDGRGASCYYGLETELDQTGNSTSHGKPLAGSYVTQYLGGNLPSYPSSPTPTASPRSSSADTGYSSCQASSLTNKRHKINSASAILSQTVEEEDVQRETPLAPVVVRPRKDSNMNRPTCRRKDTPVVISNIAPAGKLRPLRAHVGLIAEEGEFNETQKVENAPRAGQKYSSVSPTLAGGDSFDLVTFSTSDFADTLAEESRRRYSRSSFGRSKRYQVSGESDISSFQPMSARSSVVTEENAQDQSRSDDQKLEELRSHLSRNAIVELPSESSEKIDSAKASETVEHPSETAVERHENDGKVNLNTVKEFAGPKIKAPLLMNTAIKGSIFKKGDFGSPRPGSAGRRTRCAVPTSTSADSSLLGIDASGARARSYSCPRELEDSSRSPVRLLQYSASAEDAKVAGATARRGFTRKDTPKVTDNLKFERGFLKQLRSGNACLEEGENQEDTGQSGDSMATMAESCDQARDQSRAVAGGALNQNSHSDKHTMDSIPQKRDSFSSTSSEGSSKSEPPYCRSLHKNEHKPDPSNRPKSSKVLKRKNTPAVLPKVERLYAKEKPPNVNALCEEEEEEEEEDNPGGAAGGV